MRLDRAVVRAALASLALAILAGCTAVTRQQTPPLPAGAFIHAFAVTTNTPDAAPHKATIQPASQCERGGTRSQP